MMAFDFHPLEQHHALAIVSWRYPVPYDIYNFDPQHRQADLDDLVNPQNRFFAILNGEGELVGFCSFSADGQVPGGNYHDRALNMGMGIRPDLTGQGNGKHYAQAVANYGSQRYSTPRLRVTIATFNQRAQRVWASLGFTPVQTFRKANGDELFVMMIRAIEETPLISAES